LNTNNKLHQIYLSIRKEFVVYMGISLGAFLFILFFQPFTLEKFDFNNRLLFIAGLGAIVFLFMVIVRIVFPGLIQKVPKNEYKTVLPSYLSGFIMLALNTVAFAFYLKYVGVVSITFYVMFKIVLICLVPPFILSIYDAFNELRRQNELLLKDKKRLQSHVEKFEEINLNKTIAFISESSAEKLNLIVADVAMIKSADNYVEIVYKEEEHFKKKLIRNTLKNIEQQLKQYANFIRCHRTCIINVNYIENLNRRFNNYWLSIKDYTEQVAVSRQYLMQIRETILSKRGE